VSGHNISGYSQRYIDKELELFFRKFKEDPDTDIFSNTIINVYSDHGDHMGYPLILSYSGKLERHRPIFFQMVPKTYAAKKNRKKNLEINQVRMMTHFDLYKTLTGIFSDNTAVYGPYVKKDIFDTMVEEISEDRTNKKAGIKELGYTCMPEGMDFYDKREKR